MANEKCRQCRYYEPKDKFRGRCGACFGNIIVRGDKAPCPYVEIETQEITVRSVNNGTR